MGQFDKMPNNEGGAGSLLNEFSAVQNELDSLLESLPAYKKRELQVPVHLMMIEFMASTEGGKEKLTEMMKKMQEIIAQLKK